MPLTKSPNMRNFHCQGQKERLVKRGGFSKLNSSAVSSDNLDTFYPPGYQTFDQPWRDVAADTNVSQGFKPNTSSTVTQIRLWLKNTGSPTGNITISIETDSLGVPSGTSVANGDSNNVDVTTLTTTYGWVTFTFSTNPSLVSGTQYHIVLKSSFSISSSNYVNWGADNYDLLYANGTMSLYDGTTWTTQSTQQACFEVYIKNSNTGQIGYALFDFNSKSMLIGVFGTTLYNMNKNSSSTPNGVWNPLTISATTTWDTYTKLMLHFDGTDESTTITDQINNVVTSHGTCDLDTSIKKFGTASCEFDGSTGYLSIPDSSSWNFGSNDFTIDFWIYAASLNQSVIYSNGTGSSLINYIGLSYINSGDITFAAFNSGFEISFSTPSGVIPLTTWTHVAIVRNINTWYIFINGVSQTLTLNNGSYAVTLVNKGNGVNIGQRIVNADLFYSGHIDEFRLSNGIARWTANFTPATSPYGTNGGSLTSSRYWTFADWQSGTALINTDIGLYQYTGSGSATSVSAAPISKFIVIWNNYCIAFGLRGSPSGYQYSALNDYTSWPAANIFNTGFNSNDGDVITGVRILRGKLYIFKRYSIWRLSYLGSNPTFQVNQIANRGCPSHYTIKEVDLGGSIGVVLIFLTTDKKLAVFDGYNIQIINEGLAEKTNDLFSDTDAPISFSDMNFNYTDYFHAVVIPDTSEYILYSILNTDNTVKYAFVYDWRTGGIYPYDNQIFASSVYAFSTSRSKILYTSGYAGLTYQMESGNSDNGSAINAYWVSGKIKAQSAGLLNKMLWLLLYFKQISSGSSLTINAQYRNDWDVTWNSAVTLNYDRNDSFAFGITQTIDIGTIDNMFQIKIQDNSTQLAPTFYGMDLFGIPLGAEVEDRAIS